MGETKKSEAPALPQQAEEEVDWPDTVPVEIPPQSAQDNDNNTSAASTQPEMNYSEIPQLESDIDEEEEGQFEDICKLCNLLFMHKCSLPVFLFLILLCPKRTLVLGNYCERLREIFVRVLCSSRVDLIL